jgi:hypothetical protein
VVSVHSCRYCDEERRTIGGLYDHVLDDHSEAVLAYWVDEYDVSPPRSGHQTRLGAVA